MERGGRAAEEIPFDSGGPSVAAFTYPAYHAVESQPLGWHPLARCEGYMRGVLPPGDKGVQLRAASSVGGQRETMLRSQNGAQHFSPELARTKTKSDCLGTLSILSEPASSPISGHSKSGPGALSRTWVV